MPTRFIRNRPEGKVLGVAAGLADLTGVDVLLVRLAIVALALVTGPVMILLYLITGWLAGNR